MSPLCRLRLLRRLPRHRFELGRQTNSPNMGSRHSREWRLLTFVGVLLHARGSLQYGHVTDILSRRQAGGRKCVPVMASLLDTCVSGFMLVWLAGVVALGLRANAKGKAYLHRLPRVNGVPLDMSMYAEKDWLRGGRGPVWRASGQQQIDLELEQLRQEAWQHSRYVMLWICGFPLVAAGVMALLIGAGSVH